MERRGKSIIAAGLSFLLCLSMTACSSKKQSGEHEALTVMSGALDFTSFEKKLKEKYPEINLNIISYTGNNSTGYTQYLLEHNDIPDIYTESVFGLPLKQKENLMDLSGYEFLNNYKTVDINQVTLDGSVYMVPSSSTIIGMYYNKTMFEKHGWTVPKTLDEYVSLCEKIHAADIKPLAAQFELSGNGFFDLFTYAKTGFLSEPEGIQWEQDFKDGKAKAKEGLQDGITIIQKMIDNKIFDVEDTQRSSDEVAAQFYEGKAAMLLNAGNLSSFTQHEDGSGDEYGLMPYFGKEDENVLITKPLTYIGLSKTLEDNEQKKEDALKVMEFLATEEGMQSLLPKNSNYITPLKNTEFPKDSPFYSVQEEILNGHTSTLAYAGYEPIIIEVGNKVRDWIAGSCTSEDVLTLMDTLQPTLYSDKKHYVTQVAKDFTIEETAQYIASIFAKKAKTDFGMVTIAGYQDGIENPSAVCAKLFTGGMSEEVMNAIVPADFKDFINVLSLSGRDIKELLTTGFKVEGAEKGFTYIPSGMIVTKNEDGTIKEITMEDGTAFDETRMYTIAIDDGAFTEEIGKKGNKKDSGLIVADTVKAYLSAQKSIKPLAPSIK